MDNKIYKLFNIEYITVKLIINVSLGVVRVFLVKHIGSRLDGPGWSLSRVK
jgi:hypothetical protein